MVKGCDEFTRDPILRVFKRTKYYNDEKEKE